MIRRGEVAGRGLILTRPESLGPEARQDSCPSGKLSNLRVRGVQKLLKTPGELFLESEEAVRGFRPESLVPVASDPNETKASLLKGSVEFLEKFLRGADGSISGHDLDQVVRAGPVQQLPNIEVRPHIVNVVEFKMMVHAAARIVKSACDKVLGERADGQRRPVCHGREAGNGDRPDSRFFQTQ